MFRFAEHYAHFYGRINDKNLLSTLTASLPIVPAPQSSLLSTPFDNSFFFTGFLASARKFLARVLSSSMDG